MMNITISFDNVNEAMVAINAVQQYNSAVADFKPDIDIQVNEVGGLAPDTDDATPTVTDEVTTTDIQKILYVLTEMDSLDLADMFGEGKDKPYRVLKAYSFTELKNKLDLDDEEIEAVNADLNDVKAAIDVIIKDISDGGLSHNAMEEMFGVRTSKRLFKENDLDTIVDVLKENNYIS